MRQAIVLLFCISLIVGCTTQNSSESSSIPANVERDEADIVGMEGKVIRSVCRSGKLFCSGMQSGDFKGYADSFCMAQKPETEGLVAISEFIPDVVKADYAMLSSMFEPECFAVRMEGDSAFVYLSDHGIKTAESLALESTMNFRDCLVLQESEGTWKTASIGLGLVLED